MEFKSEQKGILTIKDVADFFCISTATVRNWVKCGNLKTIKDTKNKFYLKEVKKLKEKINSNQLNKLNTRANKSKSDKTFMPDEYLNVNSDIFEIISFIHKNKIDIKTALYLLTINFLKKHNINNNQINKELKVWKSEIKIKEEYSFLLNCELPKENDVLGFIYQSLLSEGKKSQNGSYYTPESIVEKIVDEYVKKDSKVLDPCCGSGQFLLSFAKKIENPENIYGFDIDEIAVKIARINLLVKFKDKDFTPNIFCKNTLFETKSCKIKFDVIATNPPWGAHFSKEDIKKLKILYPKIKSFESFSYILNRSIELLNDKGVISFILPESILNVKTHKDIREIILKKTKIKNIYYLGRVFKNVFTPVIRLDLVKDEIKETKIIKENETYEINQSVWQKNQDFVFNIHANSMDIDIINRVYSIKHTTLENSADWALGIVTGNNKKYVVSKKQEGVEAVYKGKDVDKFVLKKPTNYILFTPEVFQQVAPIYKYRVKEKLIYKFISKNLVFAYDDKGQLTLNSANIVIPKLENYPIKVIAALFNSTLYQFIFQKKFASIKVLRSHIEQLPLPLWNKKTFDEITIFVDEIIEGKDSFEKLDNYIFRKFKFSKKEIEYIKSFVR